jgi:hypothetical protein
MQVDDDKISKKRYCMHMGMNTLSKGKRNEIIKKLNM